MGAGFTVSRRSICSIYWVEKHQSHLATLMVLSMGPSTATHGKDSVLVCWSTLIMSHNNVLNPGSVFTVFLFISQDLFSARDKSTSLMAVPTILPSQRPTGCNIFIGEWL